MIIHNLFLVKPMNKPRAIVQNLLFFTLFSFHFSNSFCEKNFKLTNLSTEQGLPGVSVRRVFQDSKGIMWFCIESVGVCSFDGNSYSQFEYSEKDTSSLSNNFATSLTEDFNGNIWIGTINGLNILNHSTHKIQRYFHIKNNTNSLVSNNISDQITDNYGNIWIGTTNGLSLYVPSKNRFYNLIKNNSDNNTNITRIYKSSNGTIYVGTIQNGLYIYSVNDINKFINKINSKPNNRTDNLTCTFHYKIVNIGDLQYKINNIRCFTEDKDSTLLISLNCGTCRYNPKNKTFSPFYFEDINMQKLNSITFLDMLLDNNQNLWLITFSKGLYVYNLKTKKVSSAIDQPELFSPFPGYETRDLFIDNSGLIWITTKFHGVYTYDDRQEEYMHIKATNYKHGLKSNSYVLSLLNTDSVIWIGTKRDGLYSYNIQNNRVTNKNIKLRKIQSILQEDSSHLWLGTLKGLAKYNIKTNGYIRYDNSIITAICKNKDLLWIATYNGFKWFNTSKNTFCSYKTKHKSFFKNPDIKIMNIVHDKQNILWIATNEYGLYKYEISNDSLIQYVHNEEDSVSISGDMPRALYFDKNQNLWVGCKSAGLNRYDKDNDCFFHPSKRQELSDGSIYNIMEDQNNNLWMGTHNGIIKYNIINGILEKYSLDYGLQGKVFELNAFCQTNSGEMYMGGQNGFNRFKPSRIKKHDHIDPIIISNFKVYDKTIDGNINAFKKYILPKNSKYLSFNFALLNYNSIGKNEYAYKLEPIDKEWVYCGNRNFATYSHLSGGDYTFSVKGANGDGIWNEEPISIQFEIKTPLIKKLWFRIVVIILALILLTLYIYTKVKAAKQKEKLLRRLVEERTKELINANKELTKKSEHISYQNKELIKHRENLEEIVKRRTHDLNISKEKAEESDRLKSAFLANMSHEIRTPLNAILGFSSLIATSEFEHDYLQEMNDIIQYNGNSLLQIINDIIDTSMIEANQLVIKKNEFELNDVLKELYKNIQQQNLLFHKQKKIDIILELDFNHKDTSFMLFSDKERLKQIITNLISNAFKFTNSGYIKFGYSAFIEKKEILFFVEDSGIGMDNDDLDKIFNRFQKIESKTNTLYRGTGLGLSICKNLVNLLGGNIEVKSKTKVGTQFQFTIPYLEKYISSAYIAPPQNRTKIN